MSVCRLSVPKVLLMIIGLAASAMLSSCASKPAAPAVPVIADLGWPRSFTSGGVTFTVYQPQLRSWDQVRLTAQAVVGTQPAGAPEPHYGTASFSAMTTTDKVLRTVTLDDVAVAAVDFPADPTQATSYQAALGSWLVTAARTLALDRLEADLAILNAQNNAVTQPVQNTAPAFLVSQKPSVLIQVQGAPVFQATGTDGAERLVNTPVLVVRTGGQLYLHLWDGYLRSADLQGPWTLATSVPSAVQSVEKSLGSSKSVDLMTGRKDPKTGRTPSLKTTPVPDIVVATRPTSLVVFAGPPQWAPLDGTQLMYATNTVSHVFQYLPTQAYYVLTSGRWFTAPALSGSWTFVANNGLPADFARIPVSSPKENVLASVAGTTQAQEAVIANGIAQMTRVDSSSVRMDPAPVFDGGDPRLIPIEGTSLNYALNCALPVIQTGPGSWYSVQSGIWFTAADSSGPWIVAKSIPPAIYTIPISSPLHWVTYVRIYQTAGDFVWVGYTPGYYGTVLGDSGTVVYGTGYLYDPYIGGIYVPAPVTYGYDANLAWTPWGGWGFGFAAGWAWGASFTYWAVPPPVPYWGAYAGWTANRFGGVTAWGPGGWAATTGNVYHNWGNWSGVSHTEAGFNAYTGQAGVQQWGHAYNSVTGTLAVGTRGAVENVYSGNYSTTARGAIYDPKTGIGAVGTEGSIGNVNSDRSAQYARGSVVNPNTGQTERAAGVRTADGDGIYHVGNSTFASDNGNIYRSSQGAWQQYDRSGNSWSSVNDSTARQSLDNTWARSSAGSVRSYAWSGMRSTGFSRPAGGFGGFGGFRGGGFRR